MLSGAYSPNIVAFSVAARYNFSVIMQALEDVGFMNVIAEDRTEQFVDVLQKELSRTLAIKDDFVKVRQLRFKTYTTNFLVDIL